MYTIHLPREDTMIGIALCFTFFSDFVRIIMNTLNYYVLIILFVMNDIITMFVTASAAVFVLFIGLTFVNIDTVHAETLGENLILNPSLNTAATSDRPEGWSRGQWGTNDAVFTYPTGGRNDNAAARVTLNTRTSGDAKWYFDDVSVEPGAMYEFSDYYTSDIQSYITIRFTHNDGSYSYVDIATPSSSSDWREARARFVVPESVTSLTIFHLINQAGTLTVDDYSLQKVIPDESSGSESLIDNPSFESTSDGSQPLGWSKGRWGSNQVTFDYPVAGFESSSAAKVIMEERVTGDAKWYHEPVSVTAGDTYAFSDRYKSDTQTFITAQFHHSDGSFSYRDLILLEPSSSWSMAETEFAIPDGVSKVTIFHLINKKGFLTVDDYKLIKTKGDSGPQGMVTLAFDDGWKSAYENAIPILNEAGFKSTQFIVTNRFDFPAYVTEEQVNDMEADGHEIGAHTRTHRHLTDLSLDEAHQEIEGSRQDLLNIGVDTVSSFAYPFGDYNEEIVSMVKNAGYTGARSSNGGSNKAGMFNEYILSRESVEKGVSLSQVQQWIDTAIAEDAWLILTFHRIDTDGTRYSTTPQELQDIVDYLKETGVRVRTIENALSEFGS